ncbi:MAG: hypothetical protein ABFD50_19535 [Smithella sp.]
MNKELMAYLGLEAKVSAAFNFFINGMISALIYHKTDLVPVDYISLAIDLILTCLLMFILTALFSTASLRRTNTIGILPQGNNAIRKLSRLFRRPVLFGLLMGMATAAFLFVLTAPALALIGVKNLSFGTYIALKATGCALLGGTVTMTALYLGLFRVE